METLVYLSLGCSIIIFLLISITIIIVSIKIIKYFDTKSKIEYKSLMLNTGLKKYVDECLEEYINDYMQEYIMVTPEFIDKIVINSDDEKKILIDVTNHVITFLPDSFIEKLGQVYRIGFKYKNKNGIVVDALTDIITRKVYTKVLILATASKTPKDEITTIQDLNINDD
jgi:hypothetical protein